MALAPIAALAVRRARHLRHHRGEHQHGRRLHRRRDAARAARREVRHARRSIRRRLRRRSCARRRARRDRPAPAVLGRGWLEPRQRACTACSCCPSRCRASGAAPFSWRKANPVGALEAAALASRAVGTHVGDLPQQSRARRAAERRRALHELSLQLGHAARSACCSQASACARSSCRASWSAAWSRPSESGRRLSLGLVCGAVGFTIQAVAPNGTVYAVGIVVMSLWGLMGPALQGLMTRLVEPIGARTAAGREQQRCSASRR